MKTVDARLTANVMLS